MSQRYLLTFKLVVIAGVAVYIAVCAIHNGLSYSVRANSSCAKFASEPATDGWITLEDCSLALQNRFEVPKKDEMAVPIFPTGWLQVETAIFVRTKKTFLYDSEHRTHNGLDTLRSEFATKHLVGNAEKATLTGRIVWADSLPETERLAVRRHFPGLKEKFAVLDTLAAPPFEVPALRGLTPILFVIPLLLLGFVLSLAFRSRGAPTTAALDAARHARYQEKSQLDRPKIDTW